MTQIALSSHYLDGQTDSIEFTFGQNEEKNERMEVSGDATFICSFAIAS